MALSFSYTFGYIPSFTQSLLSTLVETTYINVKVYPLFYNKIIVEWGIPASWGACHFNVYKGDTEVGPWLKINPTPLYNTNFIEDIATQDFSKFHKSFYIVEVVLPNPDNRYIKSVPTSWEHKRTTLIEIRAAEITRREMVLLNKLNGADTLVFRRKYFGERCPNCYNKDIEKVTKDNCTTCIGTSFVGGYFPGILTKVNYDVSPNNTQMSYMGKLEVNTTSAWTTSFPNIMTHDMLLRVSDFKIFRVESTNATELQTVQVRQLMQITEKDKASVEMNLIKSIVPSKYTIPGVTGNITNTTTGYVI